MNSVLLRRGRAKTPRPKCSRKECTAPIISGFSSYRVTKDADGKVTGAYHAEKDLNCVQLAGIKFSETRHSDD